MKRHDYPSSLNSASPSGAHDQSNERSAEVDDKNGDNTTDNESETKRVRRDQELAYAQDIAEIAASLLVEVQGREQRQSQLSEHEVESAELRQHFVLQHPRRGNVGIEDEIPRQEAAPLHIIDDDTIVGQPIPRAQDPMNVAITHQMYHNANGHGMDLGAHHGDGDSDDTDGVISMGRVWLSPPHTRRAPRIGDSFQVSALPFPHPAA